jgi:cell division protein FtsW
MTSPPRAKAKPSVRTSEDVRTRPQRPSLGAVFRADSSNYYMLLGTTLLLVFIGLIMVLSASSVDSYLTDNNFFMGFLRQGAYAIAGIPLMLLASRMPPSFWRRWARIGVLIGIGFQLLVVWTPLGVDSGGNRNWLAIGDFTFQPAELLKLALAVWLGVMLPVAMERYGATWRVLRPLIPAAIIVTFVLVGGDLGTVLIMFLMTMAALYFAGVGWKFMLVPIGLGALGVFAMSVFSPNRMARILSFLGAPCIDDSGACWQPLHGTWALASGGIFGVGLGQSRAKWSWLPAADNDYIFAIVGEELGLIGAVVVIALFIALTVSFLRIIRAAEDDTTRIVAGTIMVWLVGQGFLNIAVVLGLMPVLGVPLPFVSAGGTALVSCLVAVGVVLSFARTQGRNTL